MIVGGTVTYNAIANIEKVAASLRAVCDVTLAFDDGSDDGTRDVLPRLFDYCFRPKERVPELLTLRRSLLYAEAERLGAKWYVYHDHDEELSPSLREAGRSILLECENTGHTAVLAPLVQFWGDTRHRMVKRGEQPCEYVAWRADKRYNYYPTLAEIFRKRDVNYTWHAPRLPCMAGRPNETLLIRYPWGALLHYGNVPAEKALARREWARSIGLDNIYYDPPAPGELKDVPDCPEWDTTGNYRQLVLECD
jgi:glycosyltransferase involved in cell wall biosynthesis